MSEMLKPASRKRKRRNRLPDAGPRLVPFCDRMARGLRGLDAPTVHEQRALDRFLSALAGARTAETEYHQGKLQVLALGARMRKRHGELHDALERMDLSLCARHGRRSPDLWQYGLPPHKKRGPKGPRRR